MGKGHGSQRLPYLQLGSKLEVFTGQGVTTAIGCRVTSRVLEVEHPPWSSWQKFSQRLCVGGRRVLNKRELT